MKPGHLPFVSLERMALERSMLRGRVVLCHGCFDVFHIGHLRHLGAAAALGDWLLVTVTADAFVDKGPARPVFPAEHRAEVLGSLRAVDLVAVNTSPTAVPVLDQVRPDVYVKGGDYRTTAGDPRLTLELEAARRIQAEVVFTGELTDSSTRVIDLLLRNEACDVRPGRRSQSAETTQ